MSEIDMEGAIEALQAAIPDSYDEEVAIVSDDVVDDNPEVESFTKFDPNVLPEDMQQVYRSMQADYTRKTQEIADLRRNYEAFSDTGVDPTEANNILQMWQAMDTDPDVAHQFVSAMQNRLQEMGYDAQQVEEASPDVIDYEGLPPSLAAELEDMRSFRAQFEQERVQQEYIGELEQQEQTIKTMNPNYSDEDLSAIYSLAYSTDGDLLAASEQYHAIQQHLLGNYLQAKQVPHGATAVASIPSSVPPRQFSSLDDAHKAAMEALRNNS